MPAKISRPVLERIKRLYEDGMRISDIAGELGLCRGTVAKYVRAYEADRIVAGSPAAQLTDEEILKLRYMLARIVPVACPSCGERMYADRTADEGTCPSCGSGWSRKKQSARATRPRGSHYR